MNRQFIAIGSVGQGSCAVSFAKTGNKVIKVSVAVKEFSSNEETTMWVGSMAGADCENVLATVTKGREVVLNG